MFSPRFFPFSMRVINMNSLDTAKEINYADFSKVDMRVGKIILAEDFPEARKPAYKLEIDFGNDVGKKRSSAQITRLYTKEELIDKLIIAVVNFPPKQIGKFISEVLVLGTEIEGGEIQLIDPGLDAQVGARVF